MTIHQECSKILHFIPNRNIIMTGFNKVTLRIILMTTMIFQGLCISISADGSIEEDTFFTHVIKKRSEENTDFTLMNQNVCPPSLCRTYDESSPHHPDLAPRRPKGTGGSVFYQGDIVLDADIDRFIYPETQLLRRSRRSRRATIRKKRRLWKDGVVVFKMAKTISPEAKQVLERAMKHIMKRTCIKFRKKKNGDKDFIRFISEPGCWSQMGRVGGVQLLSIGLGCENLGTAIHEILHALGIWHEQARADRDKYVNIVEENISERFKPDFEIVTKKVSTSRGYPYDYASVMHYSKYAFTRNGEPTIKVKGQGEKLGLSIGQRKGLSTIDISQLRDMYKCNLKEDINQTVCLKGWKKISTMCYKFFTEPKSQFGPAFRTCQSLKSHLVTLDNSHEEKLLTRYLNRKFSTIYSWRTAGRRVNNHMMWYLDEASVQNITDYTNWAEGHPSSYTSMIIRKDPRTRQFKWYGEWVGSASQKPSYEHAFICEKRARRKCVSTRYPDGRDYRGDLDITRDGRTCQKWTENYPHNHSLVEESRKGAKYESGEDPRDGLGNHNKCRNPSGMRRNRPWCFTTKKKIEWDYCDVSVCSKSVKEYEALLNRRRSLERNIGTAQPSSVPKRRKNSSKRYSTIFKQQRKSSSKETSAVESENTSTPKPRKKNRNRGQKKKFRKRSKKKTKSQSSKKNGIETPRKSKNRSDKNSSRARNRRLILK